MITTILDRYVEEYDSTLNETSYIENVESFEEDYRVFSPVDIEYS